MKRIFGLVGFSIVLALFLSACGTAAVPAPVVEAAQEATNAALESAVVSVAEEVSEAQTEEATVEVTELATELPSPTPTATDLPTLEPTATPSDVPTLEPTSEPTLEPTVEPTVAASEAASQEARNIPSEEELAASVDAANAAHGQELFTVAAVPPCTTCHQTDGVSVIVGPNLFNVSENAVDRIEGVGPFSYVYNSIRYPHDFTVPNFPAGVMPDYSAVLSEQDIYDLMAFLWTLHD